MEVPESGQRSGCPDVGAALRDGHFQCGSQGVVTEAQKDDEVSTAAEWNRWQGRDRQHSGNGVLDDGGGRQGGERRLRWRFGGTRLKFFAELIQQSREVRRGSGYGGSGYGCGGYRCGRTVKVQLSRVRLLQQSGNGGPLQRVCRHAKPCLRRRALLAIIHHCTRNNHRISRRNLDSRFVAVGSEEPDDPGIGDLLGCDDPRPRAVQLLGFLPDGIQGCAFQAVSRTGLLRHGGPPPRFRSEG
ncbi:hypothetical protein [Arthrobacter sp. NA-172]|uniref:hypothetical protein n=1 Tax=Arthrobacter sp. NA-172 TaxID=3367524 RepID=UPI00375528EF